MAIREIITIEEDKCNGCGQCVPGCPEGALQIIDGKARLVNDMFCDGLGACIGECPEGAITIEKREAAEYNEKVVMATIVTHGENTIKAHLKHLHEHGETGFLNEAIEYLNENNFNVPNYKEETMHTHQGCPGSRVIDNSSETKNTGSEDSSRASQLQQWPVQLHLVPPTAPFFQGKDVLLAADCVAFTVGDFHKDYLKGKALAIACPKLDDGLDVYTDKITAMIDQAKINTLTVMIMEVPCCGGLIHIATQAREKAGRNIPIKKLVVGLQGDIIQEEWI